MNSDVLIALQQARSGGWDWLDKLGITAGYQPATDKAPDRTASLRADYARAVARLFSTEDGKMVLEGLVRMRARKDYPTQLGLDAERTAILGAFREGNNAVVDMILQLMTEGEARTADPVFTPEPRP